MSDLTLVNLNMLFMRYGQEIERELHVPLGCLYLCTALEKLGYEVDFRDYQTVPSDQPFDMEVFLDFLAEPAPVIGLSCMANLLPFTILAMRALRERFPDRTLVLGGVGSKAVEELILRRFPWIDIICRGEGERTAPDLLDAIKTGRDLATVDGISFRRADGTIVHNPDRERIRDLDSIGFPSWRKIDLPRYAGYGMMTSRGCPYPCTFCSVAPVWNLESYSRSPANIVAEMVQLNRQAGVDLFLFQDEFFVSGKRHVMEFCRLLGDSGLKVQWKAFGRVNLMDVEMMQAMAASGCVELRFGIESGSDRVLERIRKGFTAAATLELIPQAVKLFPRVDTFYVWGFPFETMDDFHRTVFQMIGFRLLGARILPSLLSLLPQTRIFEEHVAAHGLDSLEFYPGLLPEYMLTGHEVCEDGHLSASPQHAFVFDFIRDNPDLFPGFFLYDVAGNILPKFDILRQHGFYASRAREVDAKESCGAHSPRLDDEQVLGALTRG